MYPIYRQFHDHTLLVEVASGKRGHTLIPAHPLRLFVSVYTPNRWACSWIPSGNLLLTVALVQ